MVQRTRLNEKPTLIRRLMNLAVLLSALFPATSGWSMPSHGNEPSRPRRTLTRKEKRLAKRAFRRAMFFLHKKRYAKTISILKKAYDRYGSPSFLYNLAVVHALKGEPVAAVQYLRRYRKAVPDDDSKLPRPLLEAQQKVGELVVRAPNADVAIYVDGEHKGVGHIDLVLLPGNPVVDLRRGRTVLKSKRVHIQGGRQTLWEVDTLTKPNTIARPIIHGGAASNTVAVRKPAKRTKVHWAYFTATAATAVAGFVVAAGLSAQTRKIYQDFVGSQRQDEALASKGRTYQRAANAMWAVASTMTVAAVVLAVFTNWKDKKPTNETLTIGPAGATLRLSW